MNLKSSWVQKKQNKSERKVPVLSGVCSERGGLREGEAAGDQCRGRGAMGEEEEEEEP